MIKRTYFVKTTNACADLKAMAYNFDTLDSIRLTVISEDVTGSKREANVSFEWEWLVCAPAFKMTIYSDSFWALASISDITRHLGTWSFERKEPKPAEVVRLLAACGVVFDEREKPATYVGHKPAA